MTDTNPLIESIVAELMSKEPGLIMCSEHTFRKKLTLAIAEGEKIGRKKAVEFLRKSTSQSPEEWEAELEQASHPSYEE